MQETGILARSKEHILLIGLFLLISGISCTKLSNDQNERVQLALADSVFTKTHTFDVKTEIMEDGILTVSIQATQATTLRTEAEHYTEFSGPVTIEIYSDRGLIETTVTSDSALYEPTESLFELFGNVSVNTREGKKLFSEYLKYDRLNEQITTNRFLKLIAPPDSIEANSLVSDTRLINYTLNQGRGRVVID